MHVALHISIQLVCALLWRHLWPLWLHQILRFYPTNGAIFEKKTNEHRMWYRFSLQLSLKDFSFHEEFSEIWSYMWKHLHVKYQLFLSGFSETWIFSRDFRKNSQISSFVKIRSVAAELFNANIDTDGRTWRSYWLLFAVLRTRPKTLNMIGVVTVLTHKGCLSSMSRMLLFD